MTFEEACRLVGPELGRVKAYGVFDPVAELDLKTFKGDTYPTYTFATHLAEVEVDHRHRSIDARGYWAAHDAGRIVNPACRGGTDRRRHRHGLGYGTLGEIGAQRQVTFKILACATICFPASRMCRPRFAPCLLITTMKPGPLAPKGWRRRVFIPVPAAVAAALYEAVGIRPDKLPMDAETVFNLLQTRGDAGE